MSKYTTEVRYICENYSGLNESKGGSSVKEIIEKSRSKVFDFSYPIYDEAYRPVLETKILKHFYTREIGAETVGLWKLWLDTRLNEIMPYYNKMYESELIKFNPLYNVDIDTTRGKKRNDVEEGTKNTNGTNTVGTVGDVGTVASEGGDTWDEYSDTPQGGLDGVRDLTYLTNARHIQTGNSGQTDVHSDSTTDGEYQDNQTSNRKLNSTEDYVEKVAGYKTNKSPGQLLKEYRDSLVNIDLMIIKDLNDLFLNLW